MLIQNLSRLSAFFSKNMLLLSVLLLTVFLFAFVEVRKKNDAINDKSLLSSKTVFYTTGISVKDFLNIYNSKDFKSINFQFQNNSQNNNGDFLFDLSSYAWSKAPYEGGKAFKTDFIKPVSGRQEYNISIPYRYANLELWKDTIQTFFNKLALKEGINQYDSLLFIPYKDANRYVSLKIVPVKSGEQVKISNLDADNSISINPCPPDCPHRKG